MKEPTPRTCICGGTPKAAGDDFGADVMCSECGRITGVYGGLEAAINGWNKHISEHVSGITLFRRPIPAHNIVLEGIIESLEAAAKDCEEANETETAAGIVNALNILKATAKQSRDKLEAKS